jgi:hypothetical protein
LLARQRELADGWLVRDVLVHAPPCGRAQTRKPTFSCPSTLLASKVNYLRFAICDLR